MDPTRLPKVGIICDFREEDWPSMDLVASQLFHHLQNEHSHQLTAKQLCPPFHRRLTNIQTGAGKRFNIDRFLNRFWDYPRFLQRQVNEFDLFHLVDHSYAQMLHQLPAERTVVNCHDLDTFRCLLDPVSEQRSIFFRQMMQRSLSGFKKAARVTCVSEATRNELLATGIVSADRVVVVPNGVHPAFSLEVDFEADEALAELIGDSSPDVIEILHVGSTIPRKRIDVLIKILAQLQSARDLSARVRLLRVGGPFTKEQLALADQFQVRELIPILPRVDTRVLAAAYRRVALVLQPSEREGFGLPVIEALACGTQVIASDLPVLREVGSDAVTFCPVGDVDRWTSAIVEALLAQRDNPESWSARIDQGIAQAAKFSWTEYARKMVALYQELL
jgi:glycosyltransferase involved in cell wall biosynthesis